MLYEIYGPREQNYPEPDYVEAANLGEAVKAWMQFYDEPDEPASVEFVSENVVIRPEVS